jgi:hypothetical protein
MLANKDRTRMLHWLLLSFTVYFVASMLAMMPAATDGGQLPRAQVILWKVGHLNLAAFLGYWIDRSSFRDRITARSDSMLHLRRALIIGLTMIAFALAL